VNEIGKAKGWNIDEIRRVRSYQGRVWCVTVQTGFIVARRAYKSKALDVLLYGKATKKERKAVTRELLFDVTVGIALGLNHLHLQNMVHRDIATRNCLLNSSYEVKLADFGNFFFSIFARWFVC